MVLARGVLGRFQLTELKVTEYNMEHYICTSRLCGITYKTSKKGRVNLKWNGQLYEGDGIDAESLKVV